MSSNQHRTIIRATCAALGLTVLTAPITASAYQYQGRKTLLESWPNCTNWGAHTVKLEAGRGVAVRVRGKVPILSPNREGALTELISLTNTHTSMASYPVKRTVLNLGYDPATKPSEPALKLRSVVDRHIARPDGAESIIDYTVADPIVRSSKMPDLIKTSDQLYTYGYTVDLWLYAFPNMMWLETQTSFSPLGKAYGALTLFGYEDAEAELQIDVLQGCVPGFAKQPAVEIYSVQYSDFLAEMNTGLAKADQQIYLPSGASKVMRDRTPFIENGQRRRASAF